MAAVYVNLNGLLQFAPAVDCDTSGLVWSTRATSSQGQWVTVNGPQATFYTPQTGNGGTGTGWWATSTTFWFTYAGVTSTVGYDNEYNCTTI